MRPRMVVFSGSVILKFANFRMMLELCVAIQSCVYREYRRGLSTQPWGAPVLGVSEMEVWLPILTTWGLLVRKSRIQLHRGVLRPRLLSLGTSLAGTIVLNAELQSTNSILTYVLPFPRWERVVCVVRAMASSVDLCGQYGS